MNYIAVGIGEVLWDIFPNGRTIDRAPANFVYHTAQLGLNSYIVSAVGNDVLGEEAERVLKSKGIESRILRTDYPKGTVMISLDKQGVPRYDFQEQTAWDNITFNDEVARLAKHTNIVCFGSLAQRKIKSRNAIYQFLKTMPDTDNTFKVFDINLRQKFFSKELIHGSLSLCNILKINDEELDTVSKMFDIGTCSPQKQCVALLKQYNLKMIILTCGTNGSYVVMPESVSFQATSEKEVADTVGQEMRLPQHSARPYAIKSVSEAHRLAVDISAYICSQHGSMPTIPDEHKHKITQ